MNAPANPKHSATIADQISWFAAEVHAHDSSLRVYLRRSFPSVRDVDDVVQESYLRIWQARSGSPINCARGFLFRIARNVAINLLTREKISPFVATEKLPEFAVEGGANVVAVACAREELLMLAEAIANLPPRCREIVVLSRLRHLSQKEIAERLGLSTETVGVQIARGMTKCVEHLRRRGVVFKHGLKRS